MLLVTVFSALPVLAQENKETTTGKNFELEFYSSTQSIFDKSVPINLKIKSLISSERMQIRWQFPTGLTQKGSNKTIWTEIKAGDEVTARTTVFPEKSGTYRVVAEVQAWQANANYVDTKTLDLTFDSNLEIQPQTEQFYSNQRTWLLARIGLVFAGILAVVIGIRFGYQKFTEWLAAD